MKRLLILVTLICYLYAGTAIDCPAGWMGHDASCYHFSHDTEPWMLAQMEISVTSGNCFAGTRQSLVPAKTVTLGDGYFDLNRMLMEETIKMVCQGLGGYLVEIDTPQEDNFLINEVKVLTGPYFWIGGSDLSVEGEWKWWTSKEDLTYTNWLPNEPSNGGGNENCLSFKRITDGSVKWNDMRCTVATTYICEKPAGQTEIVG